ncbi:ATP-binding protein [Streptomyces vastus]|uniref:Histidine kinase/HSP90-like ATPase domain-containing protein n=1 Tax=Streptomyces vastus TaxID=285451 RepID=A0ABN3RB37_9ACTN
MTNHALPQVPVTVRTFAQRLSSTPRGARLAWRLVAHRLEAWGYPYGDETNDTVTSIAAELAANAVRHRRVPGRDFRVRLTETEQLLRIEVTDQRGERLPVLGVPGGEAEGGRGLLLVAGPAARWDVDLHSDGPGKTIWAEVPRPVA